MHFHYFSFTRTLVVDAAKMQHSMYHNTHKFLIISTLKEFSIAFYRVERYKHVARYALAATVVEGDDIGVIIVLQELAIYFENLLIVAEDVSKVANRAPMILRNLRNPLIYSRLINLREFHSLC